MTTSRISLFPSSNQQVIDKDKIKNKLKSLYIDRETANRFSQTRSNQSSNQNSENKFFQNHDTQNNESLPGYEKLNDLFNIANAELFLVEAELLSHIAKKDRLREQEINELASKLTCEEQALVLQTARQEARATQQNMRDVLPSLISKP